MFMIVINLSNFASTGLRSTVALLVECYRVGMKGLLAGEVTVL